MNRGIAIIFTVLYLVVAWVVGALLSLHGPNLMGYFVLAYLVIALAVLWFLILRRELNPKTLIFVAVGIGACLVAAAVGTVGPLVDWEVARMEKRAEATQVTNMHDEPLLSEKGNPIGIRLRYAIRFPDSNYWWQSATARPDRDLGISIWSEARMVAMTVDPPMQVKGASGSPAVSPPGNDLGLVRRYQAGKVYNFTMDLLPQFLTQSQDRTKLCIARPPAEYAAAFEKLIQTGNAVRFRVSISGTKYDGLTEKAYSPGTFYDGAIKEGAAEIRDAGFGAWTAACK